MNRLALIEEAQAPLLARRFYSNGDPGAIVGAIAHVPELLEVAIPFIGAVLGPSSLTSRLKELIVLRTSSLLECRYCIDTHTVVALDSGLSRKEALALRGELPLGPTFSAVQELAVLAWVERVACGRGAMPEEIAAELRACFSDPEIVEITLVTTTTMMLNRFCTSLELPTSPGTVARLAKEGWARR